MMFEAIHVAPDQDIGAQPDGHGMDALPLQCFVSGCDFHEIGARASHMENVTASNAPFRQNSDNQKTWLLIGFDRGVVLSELQFHAASP